jgi:hypothetical protein
MKNLLILALIGIVLLYSVPSYAAGNVFTAIPDDYYIHFFAGAAIQGWLQKHDVAPIESFYITVGIAVAKELVDHAVFGGQMDWSEAAVSVLGASLVYYF